MLLNSHVFYFHIFYAKGRTNPRDLAMAARPRQPRHLEA